MSEKQRQDEDAWAVPTDWWTQVIPFRGRGPCHLVEIDPHAATERLEALEKYAAQFREELADTAFHNADIATAVATVLDCPPEQHTPFAVAVTDRIINSMTYPAHAWITSYGTLFAAEAAVHWIGMHLYRSHRGLNIGIRRLPANSYYQRDEVMNRIRAHLAGLPDAEYDTVASRLASVRANLDTRWADLATAYLVPTRQDWVDIEIDRLEAHKSSGARDAMSLRTRAASIARSVTRVEQLSELAAAVPHHIFVDHRIPSTLLTVAAHIGPAAATVLGAAMKPCQPADSWTIETIGAILARFPSDDAFAELVSRLDEPYVADPLRAAIRLFPRRAMRVLSSTSTRSSATEYLLREHILDHPTLAAENGLTLDTSQPVIAQDQLPELVVMPPWERHPRRARPTTVSGIAEHRGNTVLWLPGEQEQWAASPCWAPHHAEDTAWWEQAITQEQTPQPYYHGIRLPTLLATGPEQVVRAYLPTAQPMWLRDAGPAIRRILGRFGDDAIPFVLAAAASSPTALADVLMPVIGTDITTTMIRWLDRKTIRSTALAWFDRHIDTAATDLIAAALAKPGKNRQLAEAAVRTLTDHGHRDTLTQAAHSHSAEAATALESVLETDPLLQLPARIPALPDWLKTAALPPIVLTSGEGALPRSTARHVCTMLALCGPHGDYAGVARIAELAQRDSLAEFAWSIFEAWRLANYPAAHGWVLHAQGLLGNDETARRLAPWIRLWPGLSANKRAVSGLDVLGAIATDTALMELNIIAQRVKFKALKASAWEKMREVADGLDLTADELADRLVPDFGLAAAGTLAIDYGTRGFIVGFDERLDPVVSDATRTDDGGWTATTRRGSLPKPGSKDDPDLAPAAFKAFSALRKKVKLTATDQLRRAEAAMVRSRRWSAAQQRSLFIDHPLLYQICRRLVWGTYTAAGTPTGTFRITEDRTLADANNTPIALDDDTLVGIAHPLHLTETLETWCEMFANCEILQPFQQLERETLALTDAERASQTLDRFHGINLPTAKLLSLEKKFGWQRSQPEDAGCSDRFHRDIGSSRSVVIGISPGIYIADPLDEVDQDIEQIRIAARGEEKAPYVSPTLCTFAELDTVTASELLRELAHLTR